MIAIMLSSTIGGVIVAALMTSLNAADSASSTVASSVDTQLISSFLSVDAQAAGGIDPTTAREVPELGISTVEDTAGWAGCTQAGSLVVRFAWIDRSVTAADRVVVTYALSQDGSFVRRACDASGATEAVLGRSVTTASVRCSPSRACAALPDTITLAIAGGDSRAPFDVELSASLRPEIQGSPSVRNSAEVPLVLSGATSCPALSKLGTGSAHVLGDAIVETSCGAAPLTGDLTLVDVVGTTTLIESVNDPFEVMRAPATCPSSGSNPAIGSSTGPTEVTVYPTTVTISGDVTFRAGRHVFCDGLIVADEANVTGDDVLWYVADSGVSIASTSTVSLTPASTGEFARLVLWSAGTADVTIASGATVHDLAGVVYVPDARLDVRATAGVRLGGVVAERLDISGTGPTRLGMPSPTLTVASSTLPAAVVQQPYLAAAPAVGGGTAPYTYRATGLPAGLTISSAGAIAGIPAGVGTATVSFLVIDATGASVPFTRIIDVTGTPPTPAGLVAAPGDGSAVVRWTEGPSSGQTATTGYSLVATAAGHPTRTCTLPAITRSCTIAITNGITYSVSVTATNVVGTSAPATTTVVARPSAFAASGNVLWLDATDPDGDGVAEGAAEQCDEAIACASAANRLTRWEDKSGNGNDALQSTSAMAGTYVSTMPAVDFDANGFYTTTVRSGPDMTVFVVAQSDTTNWNTYGWLMSARRPNGVILHPWANGTTLSWHPVNSAGTYLAPGAAIGPANITVPHIYDLTQAGSNPIVATGSLDAHAVISAVPLTRQVRTVTNVPMRLGADDCCGTRYGNGKYREVLVFDRALTATERRSVQQYLGRKWGIAVTPDAPTVVTALAADTGALVAWTNPGWDGGSPITSTRVTAWPGGATCTAAPGATSCGVLGLTNGTSYTFFVEALNAVGTGAQSVGSNTVTPGPPPAPTAPTATGGDSRAVVSWTAPVLNGHAPLLSYTVTAAATGQTTRTCTATPPATTCTVTDLTNHVTYAISITAANAHGSGPAATTAATPTWNPLDLGPALTAWYDASATSALDGAWVAQSGFTVSGATGSTRVLASGGVLERIDVIAGGTGYTSVPTVTISGGGGAGASIRSLTPANGVLPIPTIATRGSGYTSEPTVAVSGGGGSGAVLRARVIVNVTVGATVRIGGQTYTVTDRDGLVLTISPALAATAAAAPVDEWQISRWRNRAGNGFVDAVQTSSARQPVLGTMVGRPALTFSGIDNFLSIVDAQSQPFDHGPNWTVLVAYQADRQVSFGALSQVVSGRNTRIIATSSTSTPDDASAENIEINPDLLFDPLHGGPVRVGVDRGSGTDTFDWSRWFVGAAAGTGDSFDGWNFSGRIGEIIFVNDGLDSASTAKAQAYLTNKWNQPVVVPSAPIAVTPTPGDGQVSLSWRGANDFGSSITGYTATATANGQTTRTCTTAALGCTISGLVNGAVYTVAVSATNGAGAGPASVSVTVVTRPALLTTSSARLWLDGADIDGDGAVEGGVVETGQATGAVQTWADKSGRANHTSAPTTATRPTAAAQTLNGLPVITFNGSNVLQGVSATNPYSITGDRTMFVVTRRRSGSLHRLIDRTPEDAPLFGLTGANTLEVRDDGNGQYQPSIGSNTSVANTGYVITAHRSGTSLGIWTNGMPTGTATITGSQTMRAISVGRHFNVTSTADADVAEVLLFDRALTAAERRQVEEYLHLKWGLTITPGFPTGVTTSQANGAVTVSWTAPTNGGSAITGSTVTASPGGATCSTTGTSCSIDGLLTGTAYTFSVVSTNAVGTGPATTSTPVTVAPLTIATSRPDGVIFDGTSLWVTNATTGRVSRIDPTTNTVTATIAVGLDPTQLVFDGTHIWVTNYTSNSVSKIDRSTNTVVATIAVGTNPVGIAYDGTSIWVANFSSSSLTKIDPATNAVTATIDVGRYPRHVTYAFGSIWFGRLFDAQVRRINPATGATIATIGVGTGPYDIVSDGTSLWVATYEGASVTKVNPATNAVVATIAPGAGAYGLVSAGGRMWVTMPIAGTIRSIEPTTLALGAPITVGTTPFSIASNGRLWVANYDSNTLARILI